MVLVDGVRHNVLLSMVDLVYRGVVKVRREDNEQFKAGMRALAIKLGPNIDRKVSEEDDDGDEHASNLSADNSRKVEIR